MKKLKKDIADRAFEPAYLIWGPEGYLRRQARNALRKALAGDDELNYTYREGRIDLPEIRDIAMTVPFFAEKRLIVLENTGLVKKGGDELAELLPELPPETVLVMVEEEADKRSKLYKAFGRCGYVAECQIMTEAELRQSALALFKRAGYRITRDAMDLFLDRCGDDLENLISEKDKLLAYTLDRKEITEADVEAVTSVTVQGRIFDMIDAILLGRPREAYLLYEDLVTLKEPPSRILYLITQQVSRIMAVKELDAKGLPAAAIAEELGLKSFAVGKYARQARNISAAAWQRRLERCTELDHAVKSGNLNDALAVELALVELSTK